MADLRIDKPAGCNAIAWYGVGEVGRVRTDEGVPKARAVALGGVACSCDEITCIAPMQEAGVEENHRDAVNSAVGKLAADVSRVVTALCACREV